MSDEAAVAASRAATMHRRVRAGMRESDNWFQLIRFGVVGGSGFVVNLLVFLVLVHAADVYYVLASVVAYLVAVSNNFAINRLWTFKHDAAGGHAGFQALRFFLVSLVAYLLSLILLYVLVDEAGLAKLPAEAIAVATATPLNFVGNKLWSFSS